MSALSNKADAKVQRLINATLKYGIRGMYSESRAVVEEMEKEFDNAFIDLVKYISNLEENQ